MLKRKTASTKNVEKSNSVRSVTIDVPLTRADVSADVSDDKDPSGDD
jgi:hypothetical protein